MAERAGHALVVTLDGARSARELRPRSIRELEVVRRQRIVDPSQDGEASAEFAERWLQDVLFRHPQVLPIGQIGAEFAPAVPLATELEGIDALFVSPGGFPTIVETKLTTNPESRREVLAQVIDYARVLSEMSVSDLAAAVRIWAQSKDNTYDLPRDRPEGSTGLYEFVANYTRGQNSPATEQLGELLQEEEAFLDTLRENLELCRVLLLIVGDRDLLRVQDLAKDLQHGFALMHFTLAIAELNLYEFDERSVLVVPRVLARTKEIPRTVATIKGGPPLRYPTAESVMAAESLDRPARVNISQTDFERQLVANGHTAAVSTVMDLLRFFSKQPDLVVEPKSASQSVRYIGPASQGRPLSILFLDTKHGANFDYLWSKVRGAGLPEAIAIRCWESIATGYGTGFTTRTPGTKHAAEPPPPKVVPYRLLVEKPEVLRDSVQRLVDEIREAEPDPEREIRWQK